MSKEKFGFFRIVFVILVVILLSPVLIPMFFYTLYKMIWVYRPIIMAIMTSNEWLTWKEVKQMTGHKTQDVLEALHFASMQRENGRSPLISRFRSDTELRRIKRMYYISIPETPHPQTPKRVIYYEFKGSYRGGRRRKKERTFWIPNILTPINFPATT